MLRLRLLLLLLMVRFVLQQLRWVSWAQVECAELCGEGLVPCGAHQTQPGHAGGAAVLADRLQ